MENLKSFNRSLPTAKSSLASLHLFAIDFDHACAAIPVEEAMQRSVKRQ